MKRTILLISLIAGLAVFGQAQTAMNQSVKVASLPADSPTVSSPLTGREKELLSRIERLEKRLTELEMRSDASKAANNVTAVPVSPISTPPNEAVAASKKVEDPASTAAAKPMQDKPKFLEEGLIPHSFKIPGTELSLKFGGYIKADFIQDFQGIGNRSQFATNTIPINGTSNADIGGGTNIQARESRVTLEIVGPEDKRKFRVYVEGDFYGDGNAFRLRQAYGEYGNFLAGQTWTTWMDFSSRPRTLDYEGTDGEIFVRQAMVRWTQEISKNWNFAVAAEEPTVQIATPTGFSGSARGNMPDVTGFVRYQQKRGHVQLGGIVRNLRFDGTGSTPDDSTVGWGVSSAFKINPFGKDQLMGQFAFGSGISRYIGSMSGQNADALFGSSNNLTALPARAGMLAYERHWTPKLMSVFAYSIADISYNTGFGGSVIKRTQDGHFNLIWTPFKLVDLGVEYIWGRRDNQDGTRGDASRLMFSTIYRFN